MSDRAATEGARITTRTFVVGAVLFALVVACIVSPFASGHPDGLEFVAESAGFSHTATASATAGGPFAGYESSFVPVPWLGAAFAGAVGCAVTVVLAWMIGAVTRRRDA